MLFEKRSWATSRLKIVVLFLFLAAVGLLQSDSVLRDISGQNLESGSTAATQPAPEPPGADELVEAFDKTIQKRFLTMPFFGHARIAPRRPTGPRSAHLSQFSPETQDEASVVKAFNDQGWDVGLYLFGRKVNPRTTTKKEDDYDIRYRMFHPLPVTPGIKRKNFRKSKKFAEEIKNAFVDFQNPDSPNYNEIKFNVEEWTYIARPVRAVNQSCLQCHQDLVITERSGNGLFQVRNRKIGDPNGVLIYALRRREQ